MESTKQLTVENGIVFEEKLSGDVGYNIIKLAHETENSFDMIILGSHGRSPTKKMIFGSVSNYIVNAS